MLGLPFVHTSRDRFSTYSSLTSQFRLSLRGKKVDRNWFRSTRVIERTDDLLRQILDMHTCFLPVPTLYMGCYIEGKYLGHMGLENIHKPTTAVV